MKTITEVLDLHKDKTPEQLADMIINDLGLREDTTRESCTERCIVAGFLNHALDDTICTVGFTGASAVTPDRKRILYTARLPKNWYKLRWDYDCGVDYTLPFRTPHP